MTAHLPQRVESYDVTTHARLYSATVAKKSGRKVPTVGRDLWDGKRIREIREARGLSQDDLSGLTGVSKGDISRHERNDDASNPSVAALIRIALALKVPPTTLFEPVGVPFPRPGKDPVDVGRPSDSVPALEQLRLAQLEAEAPAEDNTRGDIHRAQHALAAAQDAVAKAGAALNRALRRTDPKSGAA